MTDTLSYYADTALFIPGWLHQLSCCQAATATMFSLQAALLTVYYSDADPDPALLSGYPHPPAFHGLLQSIMKSMIQVTGSQLDQLDDMCIYGKARK